MGMGSLADSAVVCCCRYVCVPQRGVCSISVPLSFLQEPAGPGSHPTGRAVWVNAATLGPAGGCWIRLWARNQQTGGHCIAFAAWGDAAVAEHFSSPLCSSNTAQTPCLKTLSCHHCCITTTFACYCRVMLARLSSNVSNLGHVCMCSRA